MKAIMIIILTITTPSQTTAKEKAKLIQKDQRAPFTGYLLTIPALSKILTETDTQTKRCELEKTKIKQYYELKLKEKTELSKLQLKTEQTKQKQIINNIPIEQKPVKKIGSGFYWGLGIGIITTVLITYGGYKLKGKLESW